MTTSSAPAATPHPLDRLDRQPPACACPDASPPTLGAWGLAILLLGQMLPLIDFSIINVALGSIAHTLHASATALELIVAVYGVAFAVGLAAGGRLGDNLGRRRVFAAGVLLFAVASLLCGLAGSVAALLAGRVLQGLGAALAVPQILATIHVSLRGAAHARALALYGSLGGIAFVIGQVLGGSLVTADIAGSGWRAIFLINLPLCVLALAGLRAVPETRAARRMPPDLAGAGLLGLFLACLLLPLALGPTLHWSAPCLAVLAATVPLLAALARTEAWQERRGRVPLLPPALLRLPSVRFALLLGGVFFACWSGFMFVLALTLQSGAGLSPLQSGNAFIVLGAAYFCSALLSARGVARFGLLPTLLLGCTVQMLGLLALAWTLHAVWPHPGWRALATATALIGAGQAWIVACFYRIGLSQVATEHAGAGSAMLSTVLQAAMGLGPAALGAVYTHARRGGSLAAMQAALGSEWLAMLLLVACTLMYRQRQRRLVRAAAT
ncbi:MFS transporter [Xanthomonas translucens pv. undulosa]|uniref:MFS transporter n=1 Tax=Xanthomonas campestris pv. translucens TaxID=343 RepID=UPI0019D66E52|nr:MFS transporter [Xanthomonas translucens]QSQ42650.1 MFS transporter [Xanthomonas translucens pv. translucens]QSQ49502.1 MFS transporter [Xanthomonas translucens pv. undulosa]WLA00455.1 MFS transporter [Xanthomonas translucens]